MTTNQLIEFKTWRHEQLMKECQELTKQIELRQLEMSAIMESVEELNIKSSREISFTTGDVEKPTYRENREERKVQSQHT